MGTPRWAVWAPRDRDRGQAEERARTRVLADRLVAGLDAEERCLRAFRATEVERVVAEFRRAALAVLADAGPEPDADLRRLVLENRYVEPIAVLNLMGIPTLLPGEGAFDVAAELGAGVRIHLPPDGPTAGGSDALDAVGGLIGDFHRATIFRNGLQVAPTDGGHAVVAAHPAILVAFGEFLVGKFVVEGWSLE